MQLPKIVSITCLVYLIYGLTSAFQFGTFLPPLPLKPFVYLFFVIIGVAFVLLQKGSFLHFIFLFWIFLYAMNQTSFIAFFNSQEQVTYYEIHYQVIVALLMMICFSFDSMFFLFKRAKRDYRNVILFLPLIGGIMYHFVSNSAFPFEMIIIGWSILVFITEQLDRHSETSSSSYQLMPILYGMGVIETTNTLVILT